ncbi:MAG: hypothetical protein ACLU5C_11835 [Acutalibacter sp.]
MNIKLNLDTAAPFCYAKIASINIELKLQKGGATVKWEILKKKWKRWRHGRAVARAPAWDCREERASRTQRQTDQANAWKAIRRGRKIL